MLRSIPLGLLIELYESGEEGMNRLTVTQARPLSGGKGLIFPPCDRRAVRCPIRR